MEVKEYLMDIIRHRIMDKNNRTHRGLCNRLYKYTFKHSDLITERGVYTKDKCLLCNKEVHSHISVHFKKKHFLLLKKTKDRLW